MDVLGDYLPHIQKIGGGQPNNLGEISFGGRACYKNVSVPLKISIKPNHFLYIQCPESKTEEDKKVFGFLIATLNHFLMKDITWN